jgi:hypothetical protein
MGFSKRLAAVCAAATLTIVSATSAWADDLGNTPAGGVDVDHESMTLEYDDVHGIAGPSATTGVILIANEDDGFKGPDCNLVGAGSGGVTLKLTAHYDATVVSIELSNSGVIADCGVPLALTVHPVHSGETTVTFTGELSNNDNAAQNHFTFGGATFDVDVNNVDLSNGGGGGKVCDADPAAPAWAAALLKGNGVKAKGPAVANYVSSVAKHMGLRATFDGVEKSDHDDYEYAVWDYMKSELGLTLNKGPHDPAVIKPGWECTTIPVPSL